MHFGQFVSSVYPKGIPCIAQGCGVRAAADATLGQGHILFTYPKGVA